MDYRVRRSDRLLTECWGHLFGNLSVFKGVLLPNEPAVVLFREVVDVCFDEGFKALVVRRVYIYTFTLSASCIVYERRENGAGPELTFGGPRITKGKLIRCNSDDVAYGTIIGTARVIEEGVHTVLLDCGFDSPWPSPRKP